MEMPFNLITQYMKSTISKDFLNKKGTNPVKKSKTQIIKQLGNKDILYFKQMQSNKVVIVGKNDYYIFGFSAKFTRLPTFCACHTQTR